jgi:hypothetical protein
MPAKPAQGDIGQENRQPQEQPGDLENRAQGRLVPGGLGVPWPAHR